MVIRDVIRRHIVSNWHNSSTTEWISLALVPLGSRMDSALSRTMNISLEERKGRRDVRSSGFSTPAPNTLESRARKWAREAGNLSQRMNRRFLPNRPLIRLWWRTVRAIDVFPIPPAPMRAMGSRFSASRTTSSTRLSRPKQSLGAGGGNSPRGTLLKCQTENPVIFTTVDLSRAPPGPVNTVRWISATITRVSATVVWVLIANSV